MVHAKEEALQLECLEAPSCPAVAGGVGFLSCFTKKISSQNVVFFCKAYALFKTVLSLRVASSYQRCELKCARVALKSVATFH